MKTRREILRQHYTQLAKKASVWVSLLSLAGTMFIAGPASATAGVLGTRSATLSTSKAASTGVTATFLVTPGTSATIKSVRFYLCTSPLAGACTSPAGATLGSSTAGSQLKNGSAIGQAYATPVYNSTTDVYFTNATGNAFNGTTDTFTFPLQVITLPTAANSEFYLRMQTYTGADGATGPTDFGGFAESTTPQFAVTANVQEDLTFCVGLTVAGNCTTATGTSLSLAPNPMTVGAPSKGTAQMACSTNGTGGYTIQYYGTSFTDTTADTIATGPGVLNAGGTEQFGFNLVANSAGNFGSTGANFSGGSGITIAGAYSTNNTIAYTVGGPTTVATASGPTAQTTYTMSFGANVSGTTKPGVYTANQTYVATATF